MRISSSDTVAGYPILRIRQLLVACRAGDLVVSDVECMLKVEPSEAGRVLGVLEQEGYIELYRAYLPHEQWQTTLKGNTLANATAGRPVTRAKAEQRLTEFLTRVEQVNVDDAYAYRVAKVALFGSMLSESPTVGDIDLAIELTPRYEGDELEQCRTQRVEAAAAAGRSFPSWIDRLLWPQRELQLFLRNRSPIISLHDFRELEELQTPYKMLLGAQPDED